MTTNSSAFLTWNVECADGTHGITAERKDMGGRVAFNLYVDTKLIQTVSPTRKGVISSLEYPFECGGETLTFVVYGAKIDLIHRGVLQNSKLDYEPENVLPPSFRWTMIILNALSVLFYLGADFTKPSTIMFLFPALIMIVSSSIIVIVNSTSPFYTKQKKIIVSILPVIFCVLVVFTFAHIGDMLSFLLS